MPSASAVAFLVISYAAPVFLFHQLVSRRSQLTILAISAAFFWLLAIIVSSGVWAIFSGGDRSNAGDGLWLAVFVGVAIQELMRIAFFRAYVRVEHSVSKFSGDRLSLNDVSSGMAAGIGWGAIHAVVWQGASVSSSFGPATLFTESCSSMSVFLVSSVSTWFYVILHVALMTIAFVALRKHEHGLMSFVALAHLVAALSTLFNSGGWSAGCIASLLILGAVTVATTALAFMSVKKHCAMRTLTHART